MKNLIIVFVLLFTISTFGNKSRNDFGNYQSFKMEFKSLGENQFSKQKSDGKWLLMPAGIGTVTVGGTSIFAGFLLGYLVGFSANENGHTEKYLAGTGILTGGIVIGSGLIYVGVRMFNKGSSSIIERRTSKQKQLDSIQKFEGY